MHKIKKIHTYYVHTDYIQNISITQSSNPNINLITHKFKLEKIERDSELFTSAIVYNENDILTSVNNLNTIKIPNVGCITYMIPIFKVNSQNMYYVNENENQPIISKIISGSGKFANIDGIIETTYDKKICYTTIKYTKKDL